MQLSSHPDDIKYHLQDKERQEHQGAGYKRADCRGDFVEINVTFFDPHRLNFFQYVR